jgi:polyhydroxyalkanoate synthase
VGGPATGHAVVADLPLARLLHYAAAGPTRRRSPVLVVASLINRYYVLDLLPELSVIRSLAARGFDVYVLDWKAPGSTGPDLTFADYVDGAIARAAAELEARHPGSPGVALLGYCMGGTLAALYAALHPERLAALVLLGTPIDFHASGRLAEMTAPERFDADALMDAYGNMPPVLLQGGFKLLHPVDALTKLMHLHLDGADEARVRHFLALESWLEDNVAFPGGVYRDYIRSLYQENALVRGRMRVGRRTVDLRRIAAPLANVVALRDPICAPASSLALMDRVSSAERRVFQCDVGHIGLTASRRAHAELWPALFAWLEERA